MQTFEIFILKISPPEAISFPDESFAVTVMLRVFPCKTCVKFNPVITDCDASEVVRILCFWISVWLKNTKIFIKI